MIRWDEAGRQWAFQLEWEAETDKRNWREEFDMTPFPKEEEAAKAGSAQLAAWRKGFEEGQKELNGVSNEQA